MAAAAQASSSRGACSGASSLAVQTPAAEVERVLAAASQAVTLVLHALLELLPTDDAARWSFATDALDALACVEFCRAPLAELGALVRAAVAVLSSSSAAAATLALCVPPYESLTRLPGGAAEAGVQCAYRWQDDTVQAARLHFLFRVSAPCLPRMSDTVFASSLAGPLLLYLQYPVEDIALSAHNLFSTYLRVPDVEGSESSLARYGNISEHSELTGSIREDLSLCYIQRALEACPGITPFLGLVSGVGAICRDLPPISPVIPLSFRLVAEKAARMWDEAEAGGCSPSTTLAPLSGQDLSATPQAIVVGMEGQMVDAASPGDLHLRGSESRQPQQARAAAEQLQALLLRLIPVVPLPVLELLLEDVCNLLLGMTEVNRKAALAELFEVLSTSDDYTRKPLTIPFYQHLVELTCLPGRSWYAASQSQHDKSKLDRADRMSQQSL
eukprot:SM000103S09509  [mRNA]  locus=s103:409114:412114:+ [translate_table: standard]